jgi:hypothetical protein
MSTNMKITLAAALILGAASAALAGSENTDDRGGFMMPGSMVGVNAVYHLDLFPNADKADKAYGYGGSANLSQSRKKGHNH